MDILIVVCSSFFRIVCCHVSKNLSLYRLFYINMNIYFYYYFNIAYDVVLLCFIDPILGNRYGPGVSSSQQTSDNNLGWPDPHPPPNYVAVYIGPLLLLFERTHNNPVDNQGLLPWWHRCLGESKVRLASLVKVLSDGKISWILWS